MDSPSTPSGVQILASLGMLSNSMHAELKVTATERCKLLLLIRSRLSAPACVKREDQLPSWYLLHPTTRRLPITHEALTSGTRYHPITTCAKVDEEGEANIISILF